MFSEHLLFKNLEQDSEVLLRKTSLMTLQEKSMPGLIKLLNELVRFKYKDKISLSFFLAGHIQLEPGNDIFTGVLEYSITKKGIILSENRLAQKSWLSSLLSLFAKLAWNSSGRDCTALQEASHGYTVDFLNLFSLVSSGQILFSVLSLIPSDTMRLGDL